MRERFTVDEPDDGRRLDVVVAGALGVSRSSAGKLIEGAAVRVDGRQATKSLRVATGQVVEVGDVPTRPSPPPPDIPIVWQDEDLAVIDKPCGVVVHRAPSVTSATVVEAMLAQGITLADTGDADRPGIVHRLDRDVSGLMIVARTSEAARGLSRALRQRSVKRSYRAVVRGRPTVDRGKIDAPIGRDERRRTRMALRPDGRPAVTWFSVVERFAHHALLDVELETGRTHQIRVHLRSIDLPIVGDPVYGPSQDELGATRPLLHAHRLRFDHPVTADMLDLRSPLPSDVQDALERLR